MDNLDDDSPYLPLILIVDLIDRLLSPRPLTPVVCFVWASYYKLFGRWLDILFLLTFSCWNFYCDSGPWIYAHKYALAGLVPFLCTSLLLLGCRTMIYIHTGHTSLRSNDLEKSNMMFCRISHMPGPSMEYSFSYLHPVIGTLVGFGGEPSSLTTVDGHIDNNQTWHSSKLEQTAWYNINHANHFQGHSSHGLRGKLDGYLRSQVW